MVVEAITPVNNQRVLILGAFGMLGHDLQTVFPEAICHGRDVDITDETAVFSCITRAKPKVVLNAAAYTDVDGCEEDPGSAFRVNGEGPGYIAKACNAAGAVLIHYSTDYVFDGARPEYFEEDTPHPINVYGESKLLGEVRVREYTDDYRIIRTSWLFGRHGKNFVDTMIQLSRQMYQVRVVNDQIGRPTYTVDLAGKTADIIGGEPGIYHITNDGRCSWFEFAEAIIGNAVPVSSAEFPRKARRPAYSVLMNTKTSPMRHWKDALSEYLKRTN
jgi:dTDP-4-dehydrorhamnose reductase